MKKYLSSQQKSELLETIQKVRDETIIKLHKIGMTDQAIDVLFNKKDVLYCPRCETPNLYELAQNEKGNFSNYQCGYCKQVWFMDWNDENNLYQQQLRGEFTTIRK